MEPAPAVLLRQMRAPDKRNGKGRAIPEAYCLAFLQLTRVMSLSPCLKEEAHERKIMEILQKTKPWRQVVKAGVLYAAGTGGMDFLVSDGILKIRLRIRDGTLEIYRIHYSVSDSPISKNYE